jgi:spore coat polysaccharide biosynthesis protein SpsF (cytidylyltransferase family)
MNPSMIAIIAARMGSSRLPGKVMLPLAGKPVFQHLIERIQKSELFDTIVLGTSHDPQNQPLIDCAKQCASNGFRDEEDLADRYLRILEKYEAENFTRFCADNPLTDMETSARFGATAQGSALDYASVKGLHLPLGWWKPTLERLWNRSGGRRIPPMPCGANRLGFIFARIRNGSASARCRPIRPAPIALR